MPAVAARAECTTLRRGILKYTLGCVAGAGLAGMGLPVRAVEKTDRAQAFAALEQPALMSARAATAAFLAMARAGRRLVAVGERGLIMLSDDGGLHWRQARVPVSVTLTAVQFVDEQHGWVVGHLGVVLRTADAGQSWQRQLDGLQAANLALQAAEEGGDGRLKAAARALKNDGPDKPFFDLYFESPTTGLVVGAYNLAFRTEDGGRAWQPWMAHIDNPKGLHLYALCRAGATLYIAGEQGLLLKAGPRLERFEAVAAPFKGTLFGVVCGSRGELVAFGLRGKAFWSGDGGARWQEVATGTKASLCAGTLLFDGRMVLASQAGDVLVSSDAGRSFTARPARERYPLTSLLQLDADHLLATSLRGVQPLALLKAP